MYRRAMRGPSFLLGAGAIALVGFFQACVGDDPTAPFVPADSSTPAVAPDAESSSSSSGSPGTEDAGVPTYGVFLTSALFRTDFGREVTTDRMIEFVDGQCSALAAAAGLARATSYRPLVSISDDYQNASADLNRLISFRTDTAERAQWCGIDMAHRPDCSITGPIFASGADFEHGPRVSLFTDENGKAKNVTGSFLSGFRVSAEFNPGRVRNCIGWKLREDAGSIDADSGLQYLAGVGHMLAGDRDGGQSFDWVGDSITLCDDSVALPLLCVEQPPVAAP